MLSKDGVMARYVLAACFFFLSGTELVTGWTAAVAGILGSIEIASAWLGYSPLNELVDFLRHSQN